MTEDGSHTGPRIGASFPRTRRELLTFPLGCRAVREASFGEAAIDEVGASLDAAQAAADGLDKVVAVAEDGVGGSAAPEQ